MSGVANPKLALRPYLPADAAMLAVILRASVEDLTEDDYNEEQQEAWASTVDDETDFAARLAERLTLVATLGGAPIGFVALEGNDKIDLLYVHPAATEQGVAAMLCDAIEKLAAARGADKLKVEASDTAEGFFAHRGYVAQQRNTVLREGVWLANTTMHKQLAAKAAT